MAKSEWSYKTAGEVIAALAAKAISSVELVEDAISRIERHDGRINAICVRDFSRALEAARAADRALARGERLALLGVPMTIKESFNLAGAPTSWGFPQHKDFVPGEDALAVARVKAAGAVILGKTNVPTGLADWQSYNDLYGTTNNPFDMSRTPGGSSGGSAAALAAGYGPLSLGSDIGGSLRAPAHYCGVYAHKPTFGLAPSRGHGPPPFPALPSSTDLAVIGPMARSADDLARLLDVIAGPDELEDGGASRITLPAARHERLGDYRVVVLDAHPLLPSAASVRDAIGALAARLERAGVNVVRDASVVPDLARGGRLFLRLLCSILSANWSPGDYANAQTGAANLAGDDESLAAEMLRGATLTHREWIGADRERARLRAQWRGFFEDFDCLICPVAPTPAFPHDHVPDQNARPLMIDGARHPYSSQFLWAGVATAPGLPATAAPIGLSPEGLPIGVQIIGPRLHDRTPLKLASLIEREFGGFAAPPGFAD